MVGEPVRDGNEYSIVASEEIVFADNYNVQENVIGQRYYAVYTNQYDSSGKLIRQLHMHKDGVYHFIPGEEKFATFIFTNKNDGTKICLVPSP